VNVTFGTGADDGTDLAIDDILDAVTGTDAPGDVAASIGVAVVPDGSSNDVCAEYAGNTYTLDEADGLPEFPVHPNCIHSKEVVLL
jgi:pyruvoyl-dependent arginine decarboxylase (PvlArgDC)